MSEDDVEDRIRQRAHRIWIDEGMLDGKASDHRDLAKLISQEDAQGSMLISPQMTLTYQSEGKAPSRPSKIAESETSTKPRR